MEILQVRHLKILLKKSTSINVLSTYSSTAEHTHTHIWETLSHCFSDVGFRSVYTQWFRKMWSTKKVICEQILLLGSSRQCDRVCVCMRVRLFAFIR